eukprot:12169991-Karenia_brevis.AAC.1
MQTMGQRSNIMSAYLITHEYKIGCPRVDFVPRCYICRTRIQRCRHSRQMLHISHGDLAVSMFSKELHMSHWDLAMSISSSKLRMSRRDLAVSIFSQELHMLHRGVAMSIFC